MKIAPGSDFKEPPKPKQQANTLVFGDAGNGKTTFALLYAPGPNAFLSFDRRGDYAAYKAKQAGRDVLFSRIDYPANPMKLSDEAAKTKGQAAVDRAMKNIEWAVEQSIKGNIRTITLDTGTELGEIINMAIRGRVDRIKGDYGKSKDLINRQWWRIFNTCREGNANLIVLARAKPVWENNEPTGRYEPRGPEVMNDAVDWAAQIRFKRKYAKTAKTNGQFELEITKAGIDISALGQKYTEEDWADFGPFVYACMMNYPDTEPDDWT